MVKKISDKKECSLIKLELKFSLFSFHFFQCSKQAIELEGLRDENRKIKDNWQEAMDKFEMIFGEKVDLERVMELLQVRNCFKEWHLLKIKFYLLY